MNTILEVTADSSALPKIEQIFKQVGLEPKVLTIKVLAPGVAKPVEKAVKILVLLSKS